MGYFCRRAWVPGPLPARSPPLPAPPARCASLASAAAAARRRWPAVPRPPAASPHSCRMSGVSLGTRSSGHALSLCSLRSRATPRLVKPEQKSGPPPMGPWELLIRFGHLAASFHLLIWCMLRWTCCCQTVRFTGSRYILAIPASADFCKKQG